jgi:nucleoside-diphosphate-sugar epimerase
VRALARSEASAETVSARGAEPAKGDLADPDTIRTAADGCEYAFHAAAHLGEWGDPDEFERDNVVGTRNALTGARDARVRRFVHVGTEAALLAGEPLVNVTEDAPLRPDSKALYSSTKARAEQAVRSFNGGGFETVVVRPRLVWGPGDTTIVPSLKSAIEHKRFSWIGGGNHLTATTHVDNTVHGLVLGATMGRPGGVYFVTDGEPAVFREFITDLLRANGVEAPDRNTPVPVARIAAAASEGVWRTFRLKSNPPVTRLAYWLSAQECTIDTSRARSELRYEPVISREQGLADLRDGRAA